MYYYTQMATGTDRFLGSVTWHVNIVNVNDRKRHVFTLRKQRSSSDCDH
jgi:hypothetical protein